MSRRLFAVVVLGAPLCLAVAAGDAGAQLLTQHIRGGVGLKAGSQPPEGGYVAAPVLYSYGTDKVKDQDGALVPITADITTVFFGAGYSQVTSRKIFGGQYGFTIMFPLGANNRIQGTEIDANPGAGLTDSAVTPITLGWHGKRADALTGFTIFMPTGRYTDGADDNTGLGMWGFEPMVGATVYLDASRRYHAATEVSIDFQSKKEDSENKVGNQLNLEGGVGGDFLKGGLTTGLAYYASFKMSDDQISGLPGILIRGKNKSFALGPEVTLALPVRRKVIGFVTVRYFWETYARVATEGHAFLVQATFLTKPLAIPGP